MHIGNSPTTKTRLVYPHQLARLSALYLESHARVIGPLFTAASNCRKIGSFRTVLVGSSAVLRRRF